MVGYVGRVSIGVAMYFGRLEFAGLEAARGGFAGFARGVVRHQLGVVGCE